MQQYPEINTRRGESVVVTDTSKLLEKDDSPVVHIKHQLEQLRTNFLVLLSPGDKQFKDLPKRVRLMMVSLIIPALLGITKLVIFPTMQSVGMWAVIALILAVICYLLTIWGLKNQIRRESYLATLPLPSIFTFSYSLFLAEVFSTQINRVYLLGLFLTALVFFTVLLYIFELAVNVLNVNLFYTIPLSRLGESVAYLGSIVTTFFAVYSANAVLMPLISSDQYIAAIIVCLILWCVLALLSNVLFMYFLPYQRGSFLLSLILSFFITVICCISSIFFAYIWQGALFTAAITYVLFGYLIHKEQNTLKFSVILEFIAIFIALFLLVVLS